MDAPIVPSCIFNCQRTEELKLLSKERLQGIIKASKTRDDDFHQQLPTLDEYKDSHQLHCHRNCVSTYTSKTHIERYLKQKRKSSTEDHSGPSKRTRQSFESEFVFKRDCLFCGEECIAKDEKNPTRWRQYFEMRAINRPDQSPFKNLI